MIFVKGLPVVIVVAPMGRGKTTEIEKAKAQGRAWTDTDELGRAAFDGPGADLHRAAWEENTPEAWNAWNLHYSKAIEAALAADTTSYELIFIHTAHGLGLLRYGEKWMQAENALMDEPTDEVLTDFSNMMFDTLNAVDLFWCFLDAKEGAKRVYEREKSLGATEDEAHTAASWAEQNDLLVLSEAQMTIDKPITEALSLLELINKFKAVAFMTDLGDSVYNKIIAPMFEKENKDNAE